MKSIIFFCSLLFLFGCANTDDYVLNKTVNSDLFPQGITRAEYYFKMAIAYQDKEDFDQSIEMLRLSLLHKPDYHLARFKLGEVYHLAGKNSMAMVEIERYFATAKKDQIPTDHEMKIVSEIFEKSDSYLRLVEVMQDYFSKSGSKWSQWKIFETQMKLKKYTDALTALNQLEKINEDKYKLYLAFSEYYEKQNLLANAVDYLKKAESVKALDEFAIAQRLKLNYKLQDWAAVSSDGYKYSQYHPYSLEISEKWSFAAIQMGEYDTALAELKKQKKLFPESIGLEFKIAHVLFLMKDYKKAEEAYADLYELTKSDQSVFYLAQIHLINNNYDKAVSGMELLASYSEYYPLAQVQLARLEWQNSQKDLALNRLRRAHLIRPDALDIYQEYAQYLIWSKNYVESVALLEKAFKYFPRNDQLRLLAAYNHFKLNNYRKFQSDIAISIQENPTNAEIYATLSELWYEKNKPASEIQYLTQKAIAMNSKNKNVKPLLAWALLQQNKLTDAVAMFEDFYDKNPNEVFYAQSLAEIYARNSLSQKTFQYETKVAELKLENQIKGEFDFFNHQTQQEKTDSQNIKTRLPASLDQ